MSAKNWAQQNGLSEQFIDEPLSKVTRGQIAQMLYEAAGKPEVTAEIPFVDIPENNEDAVTWAAEQGFVQGVGGERYCPNRLVTRQEFAAILYRGFGSPDAYEYTLEHFADRGNVAGWARDAMRWCVGTGLMHGKSRDQLAPLDNLTVAEAMLMLQRADRDPASDGTVTVSSLADIKKQLAMSITMAEQPPVFDVHMLGQSSNLPMDVRNQYYTILSEQPELKYAYDLQIEHGSNNLLYCTVAYMPYRTGRYPDGFQGAKVSSLTDLMHVAQQNLSKETVSIRITNPDLSVDDMNRALQQVGGSYILCQLNKDGTEIVFTPQMQEDRTWCLQRLTDIHTLADEIVREQVKDGMTETEKAERLYTYLTENVLYDHRYYSDRENMPYVSQTAYGALHDGLAICGGYAQALQVLFEKVGIPCFTVSGTMGGEYHMWNIARLDGEWNYFDATSDRGRADYWFNYFNVAQEKLSRYQWNTEWVQTLTQSLV
ncbi:MAG: transglutaminase domain-containing protein [Agathobaculum sp.]|uniref:transglutaminase domain-containing protein n=1 Tax=Agathobaculum sp. TaxID=2048138 RepID=UPI003D8DC0C7